MTMKVEIGVMQTQAKKYLETPKAGRGKDQILLWNLWKERGPSDTVIFILLVPRTVRE